MNMKLDDLRQGLAGVWDSVTEGWHRLRASAADALTAFRPSERNPLPQAGEVDDADYLPAARWAMLAGNVFEDERDIVVRLEIPGMEKEDFRIEVEDGLLTVSGEKRFERERGEGRYRVFECAYGAFHRSVPLPASVDAARGRARYRNGILRIDLPKRIPSRPKGTSIRIG
ncbi:MAG: Hsp20/alpha crystallin family protein [Rhodocyclaceae bacterium]|jgi:HSP20 family protein